MANISVSLPSDGETIDVADYNIPITTIVNDYNGNIDNSNLAAGAAIAGSKLADGGITNAKLSTTAGEPGAVWQSFTPTIQNFTVGNGTVTGVWSKVGKTIIGEVYVACGSTTDFGSVASINPPATPATRYTTNRFMPVGDATYHDNGTNIYIGTLFFDNATIAGSMVMSVNGVGGTYATRTTTTSTIPFDIATGDTLSFRFSYEAA